MSGETHEVPFELDSPRVIPGAVRNQLVVAQEKIDTGRSSLKIHVWKDGLLSAGGHEHIVMEPIAEGSIDDGQPSHISFFMAKPE